MAAPMIDDIRNYLSTQPILKAWLFGSYSRGEERQDSDIDLLVSYDRSQPIGLFRIGRITNALREITGRDVDVVDDETVFPWVRPNIDHDKILIYERAN